jgi:tRNA pseudouridine38-40 synthase
VVEAALAQLLDRATRIHAAGRTDTGVHAAGQEIAFDAPDRWTPEDLRRGLNALTPDEVWAERVREAPGGFHPRFDATGRRYEYLVGTESEAESPLRRGRIWAVSAPIDRKVLWRLAKLVEGERSFGSFAKAGQPERGTRCHVQEAGWHHNVAEDLVFRIVGDRFLHHMVRYLVGTLVEIATGRRKAEELESLLAEEGGVRPPSPAPPWGLYLTGVRYPDGWNRPPGVPGLPMRETGAAEPGEP